MSTVHYCLRIVSKPFSYWAISATIVFTLFVGTVYWLSEIIEQQQDEITQWLGNQLGYPVNIKQVSLQWKGLKPKLQLESLKILKQDGRTELLSLNQIYVGLDLIASFQHDEPVLNDITLIGLNITVERNMLGQIQVQGFNNLQTKSSTVENSDWLRWVSLLNSVKLDEIIIDYTDQQHSSLSGQYELKNLVVSHKTEQWKATGHVSLPTDLGDELKFQAQAQGKLADNGLQKVVWQWNAAVNKLNLKQLSEQLVGQNVVLQQGRVDATLSGSGMGRQINSIQADVAVSQAELVALQTDPKISPVLIDSLIGQFEWQRQDKSWQLSGKNIQLAMNGDSWPITEFILDKNNEAWSITSDYIRLSDLTAIASITHYFPEMLQQQKPAGDLETFNVRYSLENGVTDLTFKLRDGALLPWQAYPGITGLTASVNWHNGSGILELDSHQVSIYPEAWLDKAVFFDSITGVVQLQQKEDKSWTVQCQGLRVWNDDLILQLEGSVEQKENGKIINDLSISLEEVDISRWQDYVPQTILSKYFKEWSNEAFVAGTIVNGEITLQGDLEAFPYEESPEKGQFNMLLQVEGVQLHYAPEWPDLVDVNGVITGTGNNLRIKSTHGTIAGFDFVNVITTITKLTEKEPILQTEADIEGTTAQAIQFLLNSPLKQRFGKTVKTVQATGKNNIQLSLQVPLADTDGTQVSGTVNFVDSTLHEASLAEIGVTKINGALQFSNSGVQAKEIKAQLLAQPILIDIKPKDDVTVVSIAGKVAIRDLNAIWPDNTPDFMSGETNYQVDIAVSEKSLGDFYIDMELYSALKGLDIALPKPIRKDKEQTRTFKATVEHIDDGLVYAIIYGDQFNAIVMNLVDLWRGELRFGVGTAQIPKQGIRVRGQIAELSLDDWLAWAKQQQDNDSLLFSSLNDVSMEIGTLTGFNQQLTHLNVGAQKDGQGWRVNIHSDQTKGFIYIPTGVDNTATFKVDLDKVNVSLPETTDTDTVNDDKNERSTATLWPALDISIGALTINDLALGKLHAKAHREASFWYLDSATLTSDLFMASLSEGSWQQSLSGDLSHIQLEASSNDLGMLLSHFDYQQPIDAKNVTLTMDLSWPDHPLAISVQTVKGELGLDVGKGQLQEIESGAVGRVFGLLSITTIPRRLSLDFSDLFGKGFGFDSISGSFSLANGLATTEDLVLKGVPAIIEMTGPIDLVNKKYNQRVKMTPNVVSSLPLAGAVAAGPVGMAAGAAILLFDKLADTIFGVQIVNLISYNYDLTGTWDDPQLNVVKPAVE